MPGNLITLFQEMEPAILEPALMSLKPNSNNTVL
jgi:hypothetical protein